MADRICLVESMVRAVIKVTKPKYSQEFLKILPVDLCQTMITRGNINQIIARINRFRREKEDAFARRSDLGFDWEDKPEKRKKMLKLRDGSSDGLNLTQEALQRQIKFLDTLSRSIYFLRFAKAKKEVTQK